MKVTLIYRCRLCNRTTEIAGETDNPYLSLSKTLDIYIGDDKSKFAMNTIHQCGDKLFGVADLIGYQETA